MEDAIVYRYQYEPEKCLESLALDNEEVQSSIQNEELVEEEKVENFEESARQQDTKLPLEDMDE